MSSADRWRQVEAALDAALQAEPEDRAAILDRLCSGDPELRSEVESLLAADATTDGFLETTADGLAASLLSRMADEDSLSEPGGALVGRYRLVEEIGRGGMGTVWLAERADGQYEQRVALKLVKRGMDTDEILARFRRERQILARLEHPHIARLLDGGVSQEDRPYFVMEHVAGLPITEHCDRLRLSVEERLRLFVVACRAVAHAHRNLVVHRDLKPTNVLVTAEGEVKLLDFGVAGLLEEDGSMATVTRGATGRVMTPEYASPEQLAGRPVTTSSDVYQLGILLYELLTGHRPYRLSGRSPGRLERVELGVEPPRPSTAVRRIEELVHRDGTAETIEPEAVSDRRGTTPDRLRRRLRGDLDVIALRALRLEPERRYPSAEVLAEEIERHLADLPIRFGGDRVTYRFAKFVRRHRVGVASATGIVVLLVGGASFYTVQVRAERDRARLEAEMATENAHLVDRFLGSWNPDAADRGEVSAGRMLRDAARRAQRELENQPEVLAASLSMLGGLYTSLGELQTADTLLGRALAIQERLYDEPNANLAATLARRGRLYRFLGEMEKAEASQRRALALYRGVFGPRNAETLRVQRELAQTLWTNAKLSEAETLLLGVLASLEDAELETSPYALETSAHLGYVLFLQARYDEAVAILRPTLARQRRIFGETDASSLYTIRFLGSALRDRGDLEEAEALYRDALRISRSLYGEDHSETYYSTDVLSMVLERKGELAEAESLARHALVLAQSNFGPDNFVTSGSHLAGILLDRGEWVEAEQRLRHALTTMRRSLPAGHPDEGDLLNRLAFLLAARGAVDADPVYREAVAFNDAREGEPVFVTDGLHFLALVRHRSGDLAGAEANYRSALRVYRRQLPNGHDYRAAAATGLGAVLLDAGRNGEAERYLREGLAQWQAQSPPDPDDLARARALLARATGRRSDTTGG